MAESDKNSTLFRSSPIIALWNSFQTKYIKRRPFQIFLTENMYQNNSRSWKFNKAKIKELEGLIENKTWKIVYRSGIHIDASILYRSNVLAIKEEGTSKDFWKTSFDFYGDRSRMKESLFHNISQAWQQSTKIIIRPAATFGALTFTLQMQHRHICKVQKNYWETFILIHLKKWT